MYFHVSSKINACQLLQQQLQQDLTDGADRRVASCCYRASTATLVICFVSGELLVLDTTDNITVLHSLNVSSQVLARVELPCSVLKDTFATGLSPVIPMKYLTLNYSRLGSHLWY